jgi:hypothetical protein
MPDDIHVGDIVTFQQQYGRGYLKLVGDEYQWKYKRRTCRGTVRQILRGRFPDTAMIHVEGDYHLVGQPLTKVQLYRG